jgi:hypothetical protein
MGPILQFIRPFDVFDCATLTILGEAYDKAVASLHDHGQPIVVREVIAVRMFELASKGERDPDRLCRAALTALGSRLQNAPQLREPRESNENPGQRAGLTGAQTLSWGS